MATLLNLREVFYDNEHIEQHTYLFQVVNIWVHTYETQKHYISFLLAFYDENPYSRNQTVDDK